MQAYLNDCPSDDQSHTERAKSENILHRGEMSKLKCKLLLNAG